MLQSLNTVLRIKEAENEVMAAVQILEGSSLKALPQGEAWLATMFSPLLETPAMVSQGLWGMRAAGA